jgi:hypothetical protein
MSEAKQVTKMEAMRLFFGEDLKVAEVKEFALAHGTEAMKEMAAQCADALGLVLRD